MRSGFHRHATPQHPSEDFLHRFRCRRQPLFQTISPASSKTQEKLQRSPRSNPMVSCFLKILFPCTRRVLIFCIAGLLFLCASSTSNIWESLSHPARRPAFSSHLVSLLTGHLRTSASDCGDYCCYVSWPKTSRNATLRSSNARAQSPVKLEPCMMASVFGFRSASFFRFCDVSGVYGT